MPRVRLISNYGTIPAGASGLTLGDPTRDGYVRVAFDRRPPRCEPINQVNLAVPVRLLQTGNCTAILSATEAARLTGVSVSTIYNRIAKGDIKSEKISGRYVILREDLNI